MEQTIINFLLGLFGTIIGIMLKILWQSVKDLRTEDQKLAEKVASIEVLVAGQYVKREEFQKCVDRVFEKLDKIDSKLDNKEDKTACGQ